MKLVKPKKFLGQHFLKDLKVAQDIADTVDTFPELPVLEVGPGMGVLTQFLVKKDRLVKVVEVDYESVAYLREAYPSLEDHIIEDDFLKMNLHRLFDGKPFVLTGNYPYNISSQIFFKMLENKDIIPAVCCALDRQAIIDAVLLGQGMPAYGPLQRNIYNNENVEHYDYNPEKAKSILESIGCTMGESGYYERNGAEIGFVISVMAGEQDRIDIAQAAAQQLREVGIHCTVDIPAKMDWGGQQACLIGWGSPFDADDHTYKVFGTDKGANYSGYSNEKVDEYLTKARESSDPAVRKEYYDLFQIELANDPAFAFICYIDANYVASARLHGISADTVMGHHGVGIFWNVCEWTLD